MANRKSLKHSITLICSDLFAECMAIETIFRSIIHLETDFISRISHVEPGMPAKKYFKELREQFSIQVSDIIDHIYNLH